MAKKITEEQRLEFISEVAPLAQKAYLSLGKVLPSVCIGMACIESGFGYGTDGSRLMYKHHACWGQKVGTGRTATKYWTKKYYIASTNEEYKVGVLTKLPAAAFRAYDSLEQGCFNYYELLNTSLYKKVKVGADYVTQMGQIKECGYMTSSTEVKSVINTIQKYNLTQYDSVALVPASLWEIGKTYTTQQDLYIRDNANGNKIYWDDLTENAKEHAFTDILGHPILKKGTEVTVREMKDTGTCIWLKIPSGWICGKNKKNIYVM